MINIKQISKKYDVTPKDFDCLYYEAFNMAKKMSPKVTDIDLFGKCLYDKLEENGIEYRDIEKLVEFYSDAMEEFCNKKEAQIVKKMMDGENTEDIIDEEMQTSGTLDKAIGKNKLTGYTTAVIDMYDK